MQYKIYKISLIPKYVKLISMGVYVLEIAKQVFKSLTALLITRYTYCRVSG